MGSDQQIMYIRPQPEMKIQDNSKYISLQKKRRYQPFQETFTIYSIKHTSPTPSFSPLTKSLNWDSSSFFAFDYLFFILFCLVFCLPASFFKLVWRLLRSMRRSANRSYILKIISLYYMFSRWAHQLKAILTIKNMILKTPTNSKLQFNNVTSIGTSTPGTKQEAFNRYLSK